MYLPKEDGLLIRFYKDSASQCKVRLVVDENLVSKKDAVVKRCLVCDRDIHIPKEKNEFYLEQQDDSIIDVEYACYDCEKLIFIFRKLEDKAIKKINI